MRIFGYDPNKKGLIQACFEIVRDKSINTLINDLSFGFNMIIGSEGKMERLDQTITSFVLQKYFKELKVLPVSERIITDGNYLQWYIHGTNKPIPLKQNIITPYLFNEEINTWL